MSVLVIGVFIFMALTAVVLGIGLFGMVTGGKFNEKHSNKLMFLRVAFQAATILMIGLLFFLK